MENIENLNAEMAHELSSKLITDKAKYQLNEVLKTIAKTVEDGKFECYYNQPLMTNVVKEIEYRKFRITDMSSQKDGISFHIKW